MRSRVVVLALMAPVAQVAVAQWTPLASPGGDSIEVFLSAPDGLYVGTYGGNVYRTTDLGETWGVVGGGLDHATPVDALVQVDDWLIAARNGWGGTYRCQLVAGDCVAWQPIPDPGASFYEFAAVGPLAFGILGSGLAASDDHGWTWTPVSLPVGGRVRSLFAYGGTLFAVGEDTGTGIGELFRSADAGGSWDPVAGISADVDVIAATLDQGRIVISSYRSLQNMAVYGSTDDGLTWSQVNPLPNGYPASGLASSNGWLAVGFSGEDANGDTVYLTTDLSDWQPFTSGLPPFARPVSRLVARDGYLFKTGGTVTTYRAPVPQAPAALFADGFETGDTSNWSATVP